MGVSANASVAEIREAYRKQAMALHQRGASGNAMARLTRARRRHRQLATHRNARALPRSAYQHGPHGQSPHRKPHPMTRSAVIDDWRRL